MKTLTLESALFRRVGRLAKKPTRMYYDGIDPNSLTSQPWIAVVGSRKPTPYGSGLVERIVADLVGAGVVIVSGLAFGIDVAAHRTALSLNGQTIAVLPSDVAHIYPASHRGDAKEICKSGSLISEYEHSPFPRRHEFLDRNRIIAALSDAVFIPEAAERSGSLNTAMHANSVSTPVFVAPGRIIDHMSAGTNELIACDKAKLVTSASDILSALQITLAKQRPSMGNNTHESAVLLAIESGIRDTALIQQRVHMGTANLQTILTTLEINGQIAQDALGQWA